MDLVINTFLILLADEKVQGDTDGTVRNVCVFTDISKQVALHDFQHNTKQCREKLKKLKCD